MSSIFMSPFVVAVAGCLMILGLGIFGIYSEIDQRRVRSQERMTLLARGMSIDDIERLQRQVQNEDVSDPVRTMNNIRRTAMILFGSGAGIIAFGLLLAAVLQMRVLLVVPAAGLIPVRHRPWLLDRLPNAGARSRALRPRGRYPEFRP